ncbi:MAG: HDOD domain-containing protein [Campylobacterales bacterium]|nr:HDOD domain-containing protein [Campylobacterales bacterium]
MSDRYLGRQPIINAKAKIVAYDLLYRESGHNDDNGCTAAVISNLLISMESVLGKHIGFVRVNREFLDYDVMDLLPYDKVVYSLFADTVIDEALVQRMLSLKAQGYNFALNECIYNDETIQKYVLILPYLSYLKIDASLSDLSQVGRSIPLLHEVGIQVIGTKIETHEMYELCLSMGFDAFQGYFISEPNIIKNISFSPEQEGIFHLWNLIQSEIEIPELVEAFQSNHAISLKLLRFINSAAFSLKNPISSIRQVLTLMGRDPISSWIMLMMFSDAQSQTPQRAPLLLMVVNRTEMMSALVKILNPKASKEDISKAYFTGMLSLIHLLFHMPQSNVLSKLNIAYEIEDAVLDGIGFYGELLDLVRSIELFDTEAIEVFLAAKGLKYAVIEPLIQHVMEKVNTFESAMEQ